MYSIGSEKKVRVISPRDNINTSVQLMQIKKKGRESTDLNTPLKIYEKFHCLWSTKIVSLSTPQNHLFTEYPQEKCTQCNDFNDGDCNLYAVIVVRNPAAQVLIFLHT